MTKKQIEAEIRRQIEAQRGRQGVGALWGAAVTTDRAARRDAARVTDELVRRLKEKRDG